MNMPNKTIYVTEDDLPIFERAQELAGNNLSATIAQALKRFIRAEEAKRAGFQEVAVKIGENGTYVQKRFMGKELARTQIADPHEETLTEYIVYETAKHRYALYMKTRHHSLSVLIKSKVEEKLAEKFNFNFNLNDGIGFWTVPDSYRLEVFETKEDLRAHIPEVLYETLNQNIFGDGDDFLDI